ncbi:hypothetical protein AHF37_05568 [Paragonimus kellicotti]|nr:hypothetical protein AHF37_05568 [Paragonimus kellicotti]
MLWHVVVSFGIFCHTFQFATNLLVHIFFIRQSEFRMSKLTPHVIDSIDLTNEVAEAANVDRKLASKVISMFEEGYTVPFIARYRKEATGGLEPTTLHRLKQKITDCKVLIEKIDKSLQYFSKKGLITDDLSRQIKQCRSLEEVKLVTEPLKPKGPRTLCARAKAVKLEALALQLLNSGQRLDIFKQAPVEALDTFKSRSAIEEAVRHILADIFAKDLDLIRHAEKLCATYPPTLSTTKKTVRAKGGKQKQQRPTAHQVSSMDADSDDSLGGLSVKTEPTKVTKDDLLTFKTYWNFSRLTSQLHAHQILAINRAVERGVLTLKLTFQSNIETQTRQFLVEKYLPSVHSGHWEFVHAAFSDAWKRLIEPHLTRTVRCKLTAKAQEASVEVFEENLRRRLMTAPLRASAPNATSLNCDTGVISSSAAAPGDRLPVVGLDPGFSHGCKWAACDPHGDVLATGIVWPPTTSGLDQSWRGSHKSNDNGLANLTATMQRHNISTIALGNGQGSRQTGRWLAELITIGHFHPLSVRFAVISEAGASWYSASALADEELPNLDVTFRGAVSIARRLQDPLAELIKVEPKHLGVGMYQHDLPEKRLLAAVDGVMEECISFVGVDLNAAPLHILSRVAGLSKAKAKSILQYRSQVGVFRTRMDLLKIKGIGPTTFAQCAGFVRIRPTFSNIQLDGSRDVQMISISSDEDTYHAPGSKRKRASSSVNNMPKRKQRRTLPDSTIFNPLDQTAVHTDTYEIATS